MQVALNTKEDWNDCKSKDANQSGPITAFANAEHAIHLAGIKSIFLHEEKNVLQESALVAILPPSNLN